MRVLVCGGRDFADEAFLRETLDRLHASYGFTVLIEGDARGADRMAGAWAEAKGIEHLAFPANWSEHGRDAALIRNERMLREGKPDLVIAFPGGGGTGHTCHMAEQMGVPVVRVAPGP